MRKRVNALLFSVVAHVVLILLASVFFDEVRNEVDAIMVEWVKLPRVTRKQIKAIKLPQARELERSNIAVPRSSVKIQAAPGPKGVLGDVRTPSIVITRNVAEIETNAQIRRRPDEEALARRSGGELGTGRGLEGTLMGASDELRKGRRNSGRCRGNHAGVFHARQISHIAIPSGKVVRTKLIEMHVPTGTGKRLYQFGCRAEKAVEPRSRLVHDEARPETLLLRRDPYRTIVGMASSHAHTTDCLHCRICDCHPVCA